jgi:hypothetical protein
LVPDVAAFSKTTSEEDLVVFEAKHPPAMRIEFRTVDGGDWSLANYEGCAGAYGL